MDVLRNRDLLVQAVMDDGYFHASERMDTMVRLRDQPVSLALLHATQLHIDPMGTNKATGLVGMCHELGVSFDDVMAWETPCATCKIGATLLWPAMTTTAWPTPSSATFWPVSPWGPPWA